MSKEATAEKAPKKKSKAKKIVLGVVLAVLVIVIVAVAATYAIVMNKQSDFKFVKVEGGYEVGYDISAKDVGDPDLRLDLVIPAEHDGQPVVGIAKSAFVATPLRSIKIPESITYIGEKAFDGRDNLTDVIIEGNGLKTVGKGAFMDCKALKSLDLPDSVESIGANAFMNCIALTSFDIPVAVTKIESAMFYSCLALTRVTGTGIMSIGESAFQWCNKLWDFNNLELTKGATVADNAFEGCTQLKQDGYLSLWLQQWK